MTTGRINQVTIRLSDQYSPKTDQSPVFGSEVNQTASDLVFAT